MQQMWKTFPRDLEQKLSQLLDEAVPNAAKSFQLFKSCQREKLWSASFEVFAARLNEFCAVPRRARNKSRMDQYLNHPMDADTFEQFHLTYRTASIEPSSVRQVASWAHHLMRLNMRVDENAISIQTIEKTLQKLTNPKAHEKETDLEFADFCEAWNSIAGILLGEEKRFVLRGLLKDLKKLDVVSRTSQVEIVTSILPVADRACVRLTPHEMGWAADVCRSAFAYADMPKLLAAVPEMKPPLIELSKLVTLYNMIQLTDNADILKHFESVRLTILDRCEHLLFDQAC